jgi:ubiquinone/menaquinone biosynthesis C-methylase UbiE
MERYDTIGTTYNSSRNADARIAHALKDLLALPIGASIADVGAGTGNYSNALADCGFRIIAVEPSLAMRQQATPHAGVEWIVGSAEAIPLEDASVDGVIATLAVHHFSDVAAAALEMRRIAPRGPIVLLTIDPRRGEPFWFADYFPGIYQKTYRDFPPINDLVATFLADSGWIAEVRSFPLPDDLTDLNMNAGWNRPEIYLDDRIREGMSGFALADPEEVRAGLARLRSDLADGGWDARHGDHRGEESRDLGFAFVKMQPVGA